MNTERYKSIALSMDAYKKLKSLAAHCYDAPISMAKMAEMLVLKKFDETPIKNGSKRT